jgi:hypothetical protein
MMFRQKYFMPLTFSHRGDSKLLVESINLQRNTLKVKLTKIIADAGNALFLCTYSQHLYMAEIHFWKQKL